MPVITTDLLAIYLHDHLAGATFGGELARRASASNQGTPYGAFLSELAREIEEDREELETLIEDLGVGRDRVKTSLAWAAEKMGRLKPNGRLRTYSPLSRVLELEGLRMGVQAKLSLWQSLREIAAEHPKLDGRSLARLSRRAERQLEGLAEQHGAAARDAFGGG